MRRALGAAALGLLALALVLADARAHAPTGQVISGVSHLAPMASINIGELFGDENEPDENETDEGGTGAQPQDQGSSGVSLPVVILLVALAGALGGYVYIRIRRLVLRVRAWGRGLWARL